MNCPKCGAFNTDDALNCTTCGEVLKTSYEGPIETAAPNNTEYQPQPQQPVYQAAPVYQQQGYDQFQPQYQTIEPATAPTPKKDTKKIVAIAVAAVVLIAVIVGGIFIYKYFSSRVNVDDYIGNENEVVTFSGYDGYGVVNYANEDVIDFFEIYNDLGGEPFGDFSSYDDYAAMSEKKQKQADKFMKAFKVKFDNETELKNGDTVTLTISIDCDRINDNFEFENKLVGNEEYTKELTVSGLKEMQEIDPFELISSVVYDNTGYSPSASLTFSDTEKTYGDFTVKIDNSYGNGEILIYDSASNEIAYYYYNVDAESYSGSGDITVSIDDSNYPIPTLNESGINLTTTSKDFTPDTVSYLSKGDNLSESDYNDFKDKADTSAKEYFDGESPKFKKSYFGYDSSDNDNVIVFVYSYTYENWDGSKETYYGYVDFNDIKVDSKNNIVDADDIYSYRGGSYSSLSDLESAYKDSYPQLNSISVK